jgi:hypothetical protein
MSIDLLDVLLIHQPDLSIHPPAMSIDILLLGVMLYMLLIHQPDLSIHPLAMSIDPLTLGAMRT